MSHGRPKAGTPGGLLREALANEDLPGEWAECAEEQIREALERTNTQAEAAALLGMSSVRPLQNLLRDYTWLRETDK